jgi:hypothetical protein
MKRLTCMLLLSVAGLSGCTLDSPAYSAKERFAEISRNQYAESLQVTDDFDHMMLLRPSGQLTIWNIYHRE